ncbi:MAG TPA: hypothetical protein VFU31_24815 [Candidatus Binatia bacterium]|nr:hypothetical protein [Candidatus Binatia bacterium]
MQLTIESVQKTKTGKSLGVKANGKDYLAKLDSGIQAGMTIDAETETTDYNGKTYTWIGKYRAVEAAKGNGAAPTGGLAWLPMASNLTAHAITAGLVKDPADVKLWIAATKQAFEEVSGNPPF